MALSPDILRASILGAHERVKRAEADLDAALTERAAYIIEAIDGDVLGASEIAKHVGLTRDAVYKIVRRHRERPRAAASRRG